MRSSLLLLLTWALLLCLGYSSPQFQTVFNDIPEQETVTDRLGAVASENKICSHIGIDLLKTGGNAADAVSRDNHIHLLDSCDI